MAPSQIHKHKFRLFRTNMKASTLIINYSNSSRKKPRLAYQQDRITYLHESLLTHILSLLPTKEAVRTSILSKDWRDKWTCSYNVDIGTSDPPWRAHLPETYINSMNKILVSPEHVRSFRYTCWREEYSSYLQCWINNLLRHNVEDFLVYVHKDSVEFPTSLLNSNSLRELSVWQLVYRSHVNVNVFERNCAPKLTSLHLFRVHIVNESLNCSNVKFNFPVLERFVFKESKWLNVESVEVTAPSLSTFILQPLRDDEDNEYSIEIVAPVLTRFSCYNGLPRNFILNGSSVISVDLFSSRSSQIFKRIGSRATNLLNGFTDLEELALSSCMAEVLREGPPLQCHGKLRRLTLLHGRCTVEQLFNLLHAMPTLKFFSVYVDHWRTFNYETILTPSCIVTDLEEVLLQDFSGEGPHYKLAEILLGLAAQLKKFTVTTCDGDRLHKINKDLLLLPRCSEVASESIYSTAELTFL